MYRLGVDYPSLIKECSRGWSPCRHELLSQIAGPVGEACSGGNTPECREAARHEALKRLAAKQGWPSGTVSLAERCLDGDEKACAKLSAYIAAQAVCVYYTGGACEVCCGKLVGPLVELVWPVLGPFIEGIVGFVVELGSLALEAIGLKDEPTAADWASPMKQDAEKKSAAFIEKWLQAVGPDNTPSLVVGGEIGDAMGSLAGPVDDLMNDINEQLDAAKPDASSMRRVELVESLRVAPSMKQFQIEPYVDLSMTPVDCLETALRGHPGGGWYKELWMPTNWGIVKLPKETAPFGWKVDLEFKKWERDDAYKVASERMAKMYETRLRVLSNSAAKATGMVAAVRQGRLERDQRQTTSASSSSFWTWAILLGALGAGAYAWRQSR